MVKYDIYTYDELTDSLFLAFPVEYEVKEVIALEEEVLLEIDMNGRPRALEILNASKNFNVSKESLSKVKKLEMLIEITNIQIMINVSLTLNTEQPVIVSETVGNISNSPNTTESLAVSF